MSYTTPWFFRNPKFISKEDAQKKETERRTSMSQALSQREYKPKKGLFAKAVGHVTSTVGDVGGAVGDVAEDVGRGAWKGLETWNQQVQSVPAALFTRGVVEDGQYTTQRNLIGNPFANIASHIAAQREAGVLPEEGFAPFGLPIEQGFASARKAGQAFEQDPNIPEGVKFATGVGFDPTMYIGAGAIARGAGKVLPAVTKPGLRGGFLRGALGLAEGFDKPSTTAKFIAGGAAGAEVAARTDIPGVPEPVERLGLPLLTGGAAAAIRPRSAVQRADELLRQIDEAVNEPVGTARGEPVAAGMVRENPEIVKLQTDLDSYRKDLDEFMILPQTGEIETGTKGARESLRIIRDYQSQIEQLGGRDRGFPSRYEIQEQIKEVEDSIPPELWGKDIEEGVDPLLDTYYDLRSKLRNYDQLKTLHEGTITEAPGYADIEEQRLALIDERDRLLNQSNYPEKDIVSEVDRRSRRLDEIQLELNQLDKYPKPELEMSLEEAQNLSNLSDIPDERLVRLIDDSRRKLGAEENQYTASPSELSTDVKADLMRRAGQLANYEDEARRRPHLNLEEEIEKLRGPSLEQQLREDEAKVARAQFREDDIKAGLEPEKLKLDPFGRPIEEPVVRAEKTGLENLDISDLQAQRQQLESSNLPEWQRDLLIKEYDRELRNRSIGGGAGPETLVRPREIQPGLSRSQEIGNLVTEAKRKLFGHGIKSHEVATPLADEYARMNRIIRRQGERIHKLSVDLEREFFLDESGLITSINGAEVNTTIQDMAREYSKYRKLLTPDQHEMMQGLKRDMDNFYATLEQFEVAPPKLDITDPQGFYLPRDITIKGEEILPELSPRGAPLGGGKKGFEKPQRFKTMTEGMERGYKYPKFSEAMSRYGVDVADRTSETWLANKIKELTPTTKQRGVTGQVRLYQTSGVKAIELPSEISDVINRELNQVKGINRSEFDKLFTSINNTMRAMWAAGDASRMGIQSLLFAFDNPKVAAKSFKASMNTLVDPGAAGAFIRRFDDVAYIENRPTSVKWISHGLEMAKASGEGTDIGGLSGAVEKVPGFGQALKSTSRLFSEGGNIDRLNMADMLYRQWKEGGPRWISHLDIPPGASEDSVLDSIAAAVNRSTGYSDKAFGGDVGQALMFAPRFFQSQLETVFKAAHGKGVESQVARRQLLKTISLGTAITFAINEARGNDTVVDPRSSNFLRIRDVFGADVSIFGPWDSLIRAFVQTVPHIKEDGDFTLGDPSYILRTKLSPVLSTAVSLVTGKTFLGDEAKDPQTLFRNLFLPFALREAGKEPTSSTALAFLGIKSSPLTNREQVDNMMENEGISKSDPDYLIKRRDWIAENQDRLPKSEFGKYQRSEEIQQDITDRRVANEQELTSGAITLTQFRENRSKLLQEQRNRLDEVLGDIKSKPKTKQERWLKTYFELFDKSAKPGTKLLDSTQFDTNVAEWTDKNGTEALDFIQRYLGAGLGEVESQYYQDILTLQKSGYFDLPRYHGMNSGLSDEEIDSLAQQVTSERIANPRYQNESFASTARRVLQGISYSELRDVINSQKKAYQNPQRELLKKRYAKELLWFNSQADWNAYSSYQGTPSIKFS